MISIRKEKKRYLGFLIILVVLTLCSLNIFSHKISPLEDNNSINHNEGLNPSYTVLLGQGGKSLNLNTDSPVIISDGTGGAIIAGYGISVQRVNSSGDFQWNESGVIVSPPLLNTMGSDISEDNNGGAIITWNDFTNYNIYVQKINSSGHLQWDNNSIPISTAAEVQINPQISSDGTGGAIIVWRDYRDGSEPSNTLYDVYAQRVNSTGHTQWTQDGILIYENQDFGYSGSYPKIMSDGEGGAIVSWHGNNTIYAQKINATGHIQWITNGLAIGKTSQSFPTMTSDGLGGAIFAWVDRRNYYPDKEDIYAQRVNSTGSLQWGLNGIPITTKVKSINYIQICYVGNETTIVSWVEYSNNNEIATIYAQLIDNEGKFLWSLNGVVLGSETYTQPRPQMNLDGAGGAFVAWIHRDSLSENVTIRIQKIDSEGRLNWFGGGLFMNNAYPSGPFRMKEDGFGGSFLVWRDYGYHAYLQIISNNDDNPLSNHPDDITIAKSSFIKWSLYDDYGGGHYRILTNNSNRNSLVWLDWTSWTNNSLLNIPIIPLSPGSFYYKIEFYDDQQQLGITDTVLVTILDTIPTSSHPEDVTTLVGGSETINWILNDNFGGGQYRVWSNDSNGNYYSWKGWTSWTNNSQLNIPINRSKSGIYNYTIEYYDNYNNSGISDTVLVTIIENQIISGSNIYLILLTSFISISVIIRLTFKKRNLA